MKLISMARLMGKVQPIIPMEIYQSQVITLKDGVMVSGTSTMLMAKSAPQPYIKANSW